MSSQNNLDISELVLQVLEKLDDNAKLNVLSYIKNLVLLLEKKNGSTGNS
jgi:hypothetical protein